MVLFSIGMALEMFEHYSPLVEAVHKSAARGFMKALGTGGDQEQRALQKFLTTLFKQESRDSSQYFFTAYCFLIF